MTKCLLQRTFFRFDDLLMYAAMKLRDEPLRIVERGIESVGGLSIEEISVHAAEEVSIDLCGIKRIA